MGLKDQLANNGSNLTKWDGVTPSDMPGVKPSPSQLDLNGLTPPQYLNNLPK